MVLHFVGEYVVAFLWNPNLKKLGFFFYGNVVKNRWCFFMEHLII